MLGTMVRTMIIRGKLSFPNSAPAGAFSDDRILNGDPSAVGLQLLFRLLLQMLLYRFGSAPSPSPAVEAQQSEVTLLGRLASHASREAARLLRHARALANETRPESGAHVFPRVQHRTLSVAEGQRMWK